MADPWQRKYQRERAKRIRAILADEADLVRGGQGRTSGVVFALVLLFLIAVALIVGGSS